MTTPSSGHRITTVPNILPVEFLVQNNTGITSKYRVVASAMPSYLHPTLQPRPLPHLHFRSLLVALRSSRAVHGPLVSYLDRIEPNRHINQRGQAPTAEGVPVFMWSKYATMFCLPHRRTAFPARGHTKPVVRAIGVPHTACEYESRRNSSISQLLFFI